MSVNEEKDTNLSALLRLEEEMRDSAEREVNELKNALRALMLCYERRIRSLCTLTQLEQKPWRVSEYMIAEELLVEPSTSDVLANPERGMSAGSESKSSESSSIPLPVEIEVIRERLHMLETVAGESTLVAQDAYVSDVKTLLAAYEAESKLVGEWELRYDAATAQLAEAQQQLETISGCGESLKDSGERK